VGGIARAACAQTTTYFVKPAHSTRFRGASHIAHISACERTLRKVHVGQAQVLPPRPPDAVYVGRASTRMRTNREARSSFGGSEQRSRVAVPKGVQIAR